MAVHNLPGIGDRMYLMRKQVIVTKVYTEFHLVKVRYTKESFEFIIDACAVSSLPDKTKTISLGILSRMN